MRSGRTSRNDSARRGLARQAQLTRREEGASLVEFGLALPFLALLVLAVIDFGRAYYLSIEVSNAAYAAALYGTQNPTDAAGIQNAASADAPEVTGMTVSASAGCECTDGTQAAAPCPGANPPGCASPAFLINYVQVTTQATYRPLFPWPGIPSPITLRGAAWLRAGQ